MHYYKAILQYDGTDYAGFQWQNGSSTIQSDLNQALQKMIDGKFTTMGASRTDSGVHAIGQVIRISSENPLNGSLERFNQVLPPQIRCAYLGPSGASFNPNLNTTSKEYRYYFTNQSQVPMQGRRFTSNISNKLDLSDMLFCVQKLTGRHDFQNFCSTGSNVKTTIREIHRCELTEIDAHTLFPDSELFKMSPDISRCYQLQIEADGFLKQMIRHIVRGLWMVGSGRISREEFCEILDGPKIDKQLWKVASAKGLFLYQINYPV